MLTRAHRAILDAYVEEEADRMDEWLGSRSSWNHPNKIFGFDYLMHYSDEPEKVIEEAQARLMDDHWRNHAYMVAVVTDGKIDPIELVRGIEKTARVIRNMREADDA